MAQQRAIENCDVKYLTDDIDTIFELITRAIYVYLNEQGQQLMATAVDQAIQQISVFRVTTLSQ